MLGKVIQGSFLGGQPKLPPKPIPTSPPIQAKMAVRPAGPPLPAFQGRSQPVAPPIQARFTHPPGPPGPVFARRPLTVQRHGGAFAVEVGQLGLASSGGKLLPNMVRGKMEAALGADFSNVRIHVGPQAERIGAIAFTVGSDIYFAPHRYQPDTLQGQQLLGHELAHVVQQRAGRVRNPLNAGLAVVQDHALEAEADRLGRNAAAAVGGSLDYRRTVHRRSGTAEFVQPRAGASTGLVASVRGFGIAQRMQSEFSQTVTGGGGEEEDPSVPRLGMSLVQYHQSRAPGLGGRPRLSLVQYHQPTFLLAELTGKLGGWSGGHEEVSGSHHILPKSVLAWLYDHMTEHQRRLARELLYLPQNAGAGAIARLRSNLISPVIPGDNPEIVRPEARGDDPHHRRYHRRSTPLGEEYLDLVRTSGGKLEYRSAIYKKMALFIIYYLYPRFRAEGEEFQLTDREVAVLAGLLRLAEAVHYEIEDDPRLPSFAGGGIWQQEGGRYYKTSVKVPKLKIGLLDKSYGRRKREEAQLSASQINTRMQIVDRWFEWLASRSQSEHADDIKSDWVKGIPMFIHGPKRGRTFDPERYGFRPFVYMEFKNTLIELHQRTLRPEDVDWFNALFEYAH